MCVCVCESEWVSVYVFYHASCCMPHLYTGNNVPLSFLHRFLLMHCVDFAENTLFRSSGDIKFCWSPLPSLLFDRLSMDKTDSDGFFSRWIVYRSSDRFYTSTGSSLAIVNLSATLLDLNCAELASCKCMWSVTMKHSCAKPSAHYISCCKPSRQQELFSSRVTTRM